jgi:hypothetical protein
MYRAVNTSSRSWRLNKKAEILSTDGLASSLTRLNSCDPVSFKGLIHNTFQLLFFHQKNPTGPPDSYPEAVSDQFLSHVEDL